jgi:hypothetical protein
MSEQGVTSPDTIFYDPLESDGRPSDPSPLGQRRRPHHRTKRSKAVSRRESAIAAVTHDLRKLASRAKAPQNDINYSRSIRT